jgi:hypothetical protein
MQFSIHISEGISSLMRFLVSNDLLKCCGFGSCGFLLDLKKTYEPRTGCTIEWKNTFISHEEKEIHQKVFFF